MGYIIFTLTICCVYLRPLRLPIWVFSTLGAVCAYALGVVSLSDIALVWEITKPSTLALIGLILLSLSFEKLGFFTHLASCITPHTHSIQTWKFFVLLIILGSVVSIVFANDGAVLVMAPLILALFDKRNSSLSRHSVLSDKSLNLHSDFQSFASSKLPQSSLDNNDFSSQALECQENSSLGNHSQDCGNFRAVITYKVTPTPKRSFFRKLPQNFQSTTTKQAVSVVYLVNTRIYESNDTNSQNNAESSSVESQDLDSMQHTKNMQGRSILDEKCGLQEKHEGSYLEGNDPKCFSPLPHLSLKDKPYKITPLIVFLLLISFLSDFASNVLVISNLTNIITAQMFGMDFVRFALTMALPQIFGLLAFVGIAWLCFRRFLPRTLCFATESKRESSLDSNAQFSFTCDKEHDCPLSKHTFAHKPTKLTLLLCYVLVIALLGGIVVGERYGAELYVFLFGASFIALAYAWALGLFQPRTLFRETPFSVVVFSFGLFVVVFGVKNAGFLESMREVFESIESAPLFVQIFSVGVFSSLSSSVINNLPMVLLGNLTIESFSLDSAHQNVLALAHLLGCNIGSKLTPIGSLATLLFLLKLKISGIKIPLLTYLAFAFVITFCVLFASLLGLWVSVL